MELTRVFFALSVFILLGIVVLLNLSSPNTRIISIVPNSVSSNELTKVEEMVKSLVIVTGVSSNHFREFLCMIGSFQRFYSQKKIIVYDLGLTKDEIHMINTIRNIEVRYYNFSKYPYFGDGPGLGGYTFKPHIINEVSQVYDVILWVDSSARLLKPLSTKLLQRLIEFPIVSGVRSLSNRYMIAFAMDSTIKYLNMRREDGQGVIGFQAGILMIHLTEVTRKLLDQWVDCALHKECMFGVGQSSGRCNWDYNPFNSSYIGCHRFDQAALSLLAIKIFGKSTTDEIATKEARKTFTIERSSQNKWKQYILWKNIE